MARAGFGMCLVALLAGCMAAAPTEDPLTVLLSGQRMAYDPAEDAPKPIADREQQSWFADGTTIYHTWGFGYEKTGRWKVDRGQYCSVFPTPEVPPRWTCYQVTILDGGKRLHFEELGKGWFKRDWTGQFIN